MKTATLRSLIRKEGQVRPDRQGAVREDSPPRQAGRAVMLAPFAGLFIALVLGCQPSTFRVSKDEVSYFLGSGDKALHRVLCVEGDFKKVLRDADLPAETKAEFYRYVCKERHSREKVVSLYISLSPEEKKSLQRAFIRQGYTINAGPCCD